MTHSLGRRECNETIAYLEKLWDIMFVPDTDLGTRLEALFELEADEFGMTYGFLASINLEAETQHFHIVHGSTKSLHAGKTIPLQETYCRKTIAAPTETMSVSDAGAEGWDGDPAYEKHGLGSYLGTTVTVDDRLYGTLCFADTEPRGEPITEQEKRLVDLYAQWIAYELERHNRWLGQRQTMRAADRLDVPPAELDSMMEALGDRVRRTILLHLLEGATEIGVQVLEDRIDEPNIHTKLHHQHLPKLEHAGYIEWDKTTGSVGRGPSYFEIEPLLRLLEDYRTESST